MNWVLFWLFLHIAAAIIAFGPTFTFPIIGAMAGKHPQFGHFAAELSHKIERGLVFPLALTMAVSGVGLIFATGRNLTKSPWLGIAIVLYLVAISIAFFVLIPNTGKLVEATAGGPPPGPPPEGAPAGPPPHIAALIKKNQTFGMVLTALLMAIIFLMVVKPGG
ncbi:MAG: putative integral rane protein [Chloroflexota bacterium]|nr:putative integral rane protein [Chloroflexota bacterium]